MQLLFLPYIMIGPSFGRLNIKEVSPTKGSYVSTTSAVGTVGVNGAYLFNKYPIHIGGGLELAMNAINIGSPSIVETKENTSNTDKSQTNENNEEEVKVSKAGFIYLKLNAGTLYNKKTFLSIGGFLAKQIKGVANDNTSFCTTLSAGLSFSAQYKLSKLFSLGLGGNIAIWSKSNYKLSCIGLQACLNF